MRRRVAIALLPVVLLLAGCGSIDEYVGDTIGRYTGKPQPAGPVAVPVPGAPPPERAPAIGLTAPPPVPPTPDGTLSWLRPDEARLVMSLPTLEDATVSRRRFTTADGRHVEEDAQWTGPGGNPVSAGMMLSESAAGPPITDAADPREPVDLWPAFHDRDRVFGELFGTTNILGPALWRRVQVGAAICVAFLQRWADRGPSGPTSTLNGYYCAPAGEPLTPGEAETVVQSLGIRKHNG